MAYLFGCEHIHLEYPVKTVFQDLSLSVEEGQRIGVVGRNGDGKSSLLGIFDGVTDYDSGRVLKTNGLRIASLRQVDALADDRSLRWNIFGDRPEYEWASDARLRSIVDNLVGDLDLDGTVATLSGGERRRVDLARVLVADADVLLLDEPTNHLDIAGIHWLAEHLKTHFRKGEGALIVVTHDRWFLDEVCLQMWEVHHGGVEPFEGGYSAYVLQRVERERQAALAEQKRQNLLRRELAWLSRGARARSSKPRFHVEAARALIAEDPPLRDTLELKRTAISRMGKQCVDLEDVSFSYGGKPILDQVTWRIGPGDRFGLLGENGVGKSTLLDIIQGKLTPQKGRVRIGKTVKFAFLSQKLEELAGEEESLVRDILKHYKSYCVIDGKEVTPSQLLERLGFGRAHLSSRVCDLSGGQRRRLMLMLILLDAPNVLILDEPSNDLDIDMLVAMENLLDGWPGTLILVTHDRYLMERVTDHQYCLIDGVLRHCPKGVEGYLGLLEELSTSSSGTSSGTSAGTPSSAAPSSAAESTPAAGSISAAVGQVLSNAELREAKKQFNSTERKMATLQEKIQTKRGELQQADPSDYQGLMELQAQLDDLQAQLDALEETWLELSELLS